MVQRVGTARSEWKMSYMYERKQLRIYENPQY